MQVVKRAPTALLLAALAAVCSCGPSVQSIYEGSVRFEHCYRLDLEQDVATSHRQACWTAWIERYTYGQSRDRQEYARRRVRAFASGDADRPVLRVGETQAQRDTRQFYLVVPAPTSVHASPPPIATRTNAVVEAPRPEASAASTTVAPADTCSAECRAAFSSCNQACDPAAKGAACKSCDPDYKKCMQRCFE